MAVYQFAGKWITDGEFAGLEPRNVFHRQLSDVKIPEDEHLNRHILFRHAFELEEKPESAQIFITADDYYKLYLNGRFVSQGPAPAYPQSYGYNVINVTEYLSEGRNVLAVHTYYQGLINRVWVSGDYRHGLLCDIVADRKVVAASGEGFLTHRHGGYASAGLAGYATQFLENYDSSAAEAMFWQKDFDDSGWEHARLREHLDYKLVEQLTKPLVFEWINPVITEKRENALLIDFGSIYVGCLCVEAVGEAGSCVRVRCGQELNDDGTVRHNLRANCCYEEKWILSGGKDSLNWFDYKSFRYVELLLPEGCEVSSVRLQARHYPFSLKVRMNPDFAQDEALRRVWELCVRSQEYGVQEVIQDCMEREKGFYVGDGCYTALTNMILTSDDSIVRKLIDDAVRSTFITPGMVTCLDCSFMQEIAEYPLMLISLMLWHYRLTGDTDFLRRNHEAACRLLEVYRCDYEKDGLLCELDKWCVVEWPANFQDGYGVDIREGKVCSEAHVAINAYYYEAIRCVNLMADALGTEHYRDADALKSAIQRAFYDEKRRMFRDGVHTDHASYIGNVYAFAFGLCPDAAAVESILSMIEKRGITDVSMFGSFPLMYGLVRHDRMDLVRRFLSDEGAWLRILREGGTTTFEGWGKDTKWNTSLFHLTLSDGAVFLSDVDLKGLFAEEQTLPQM